MNPRERFVETLTFGNPDRIPFMPGGGRESTLARWHKEELPKDRAPGEFMMDALGIEPEKTQPIINLGVDSLMIPQFEQKVIATFP